jgi:hypothetical protein
MWIFTRPPDQLQESDLLGLIRDRVQESVTLDFKRDMYGGSEGETRKMLRDVASLANANGGILIIGMAEDGEATAAELVPVPNAEVEAQRLVASCASNIAERVSGLRALRVRIEGGDAILVWAPPSYRKPHMITFQGATEFWIRHDRQNVRMSIAEIRAATTATEDLAVKVDRFIRGRLDVLDKYGRELVLLMATPLLLEDGRIDTGDPRLAKALERVPESRRQGGVWLSDSFHSTVVPTLRGLAARTGDPVSRVLEVYRSGHVEFLLLELDYIVYQIPKSQEVTIRGWAVAEFLNQLTGLIRLLRDLTGITDPYIFTLFGRGCDGWVLYQRAVESSGFERGPRFAWDEGAELLVDGIIGPPDEDPGRTAQRIADRFWNAFHFGRCPYFDSNGRLMLSG